MSKFKFSVGPWNVHSGADSYGPAVRDEIAFEEKIKKFKEMGFNRVYAPGTRPAAAIADLKIDLGE